MNNTTASSLEIDEYKKKILELQKEITVLKSQHQIDEAKIDAGIHCFEEGIAALNRIADIFETAKETLK